MINRKKLAAVFKTNEDSRGELSSKIYCVVIDNFNCIAINLIDSINFMDSNLRWISI